MKNLILSFLLIFPLAAMAQEDAFGPQKKDNVIVITTDTVDKTALEKTASLLTDQGFTVSEIHAQEGTLSTEAYDFGKGKLILHVKVIANAINLFGEYEPNLAIGPGQPKPKDLKAGIKINFEGEKGSPAKEAWNVMDAFANSLSQNLQASVSYLKW